MTAMERNALRPQLAERAHCGAATDRPLSRIAAIAIVAPGVSAQPGAGSSLLPNSRDRSFRTMLFGG